MLTIETYLDTSYKGGIGLFSKCKIPKGETFWVRNEIFDKVITLSQMEKLPMLTVNYIKIYGFLEKSKNWYLCGDSARFTNHSKYPNTQIISNGSGLIQEHIASVNIEIGDEILCDYTELCLTCKNGLPFIDVL